MSFNDGIIKSHEHLTLTLADTVLRQRIGPDHTLPDVELRVFEKEDIPGNFAREKVEIAHHGTPVGWCDLITDYSGKRMHFDFVTLDSTDRHDSRKIHEIPRSKRPKGLGLATYLVAIGTAHSRGLPFDSQNGDLSVGSNRVWEILADKAVATIVEPPKRYDRGDTEKIKAKYRAEIPSS
jgi:hypothetical protein